MKKQPEPSPTTTPSVSEDDSDIGPLYFVEGNPSPQRVQRRTSRTSSMEQFSVSTLGQRSSTEDVPHLTEGYGFVGALSAVIAGFAYIAWAFLPQDFFDRTFGF